MYDQMMKSGDPVEARKTIPILVKFSRLMNGLFEDIRKLLPPGGTPRRVLFQAPPGSPSGTLYEAVGEVVVVHNPPTTMEPGEGSRPGSTGKTPDRARSPQPRRKSTGSDRSEWGQSPDRRTPDWFQTPDRFQTPVRRRTPERETPSGKGKSRAHQSSPPECMMLEAIPTTSRAVLIWELELPVHSGFPEPPTKSNPTQTLNSRRNSASHAHGDRTPKAEETNDSEDKIAPSPNTRRVLT